MRKVSQKVKNEVLKRPQICARHEEGTCRGNLTWDYIYALKK